MKDVYKPVEMPAGSWKYRLALFWFLLLISISLLFTHPLDVWSGEAIFFRIVGAGCAITLIELLRCFSGNYKVKNMFGVKK